MDRKNQIVFLNNFLLKLKSFFWSKDILSFLLFLAISGGFWYVHALGKERERTIVVPIKYVGLPLDMAILNNPPNEISLDIKDQGIRLYDYSGKNLIPLTIDLKRPLNQKGEILFLADFLKTRLGKYLKSTTTLLDMHIDSILIQYEKLSSKLVPIEFSAKIDLAHQFKYSNEIKLQPNFLRVYGPKSVLDTLKFVHTECPVLKNLNDTLSFRCKLKPGKLLHYSKNETKVTIFVEQFTERKEQIPVTFINCPTGLFIRTFPAYVNATFTVGVSQFKTFKATDFEVYLDYTELKTDKFSKHFLKVKNNTKQISNIRISPQEVEYILEQK